MKLKLINKTTKKTFFNNSSHPIIKKLKQKSLCISGKLYNQKEKLIINYSNLENYIKVDLK